MTGSLVVWAGYFFLMLLRISAIFTVSPIFGRRNVPSFAKIILSVLISYITISVYPPASSQSYNNITQYVMICFTELSVGLIIGLVTTTFFAVVYTAGNLIDMQTGLNFSQLLDAQSGNQVPITGSLLQIVLTICFFLADGHLLLIRLITSTFELIPVGHAVLKPELVSIFTEIFINTFIIGIKIAMPVLAASLLAEVMLGILVRTVPQMNFFVIGIPVKLLMGLFILFMLIPVFVQASNSLFENMMDATKKMFEGMVP